MVKVDLEGDIVSWMGRMDIMTEIGFVHGKYEIVRKRNCNKQLYEFVVSAQKP